MSFAHLFKDGDDLYLFADRLGDGFFNHAQLVWHVKSGEIRVRKVMRLSVRPDDVGVPDQEVKIMSILAKASHVPGVTPRIAKLLSHSDVPSTTATPAESVTWTRVSYWEFYNGGELRSLIKAYGKTIPPAIISRFACQVLESLEFCYNANVVHGDLHAANVWVHWKGNTQMPDFYLGDFGISETIDDINERSATFGMSFKSWDIPDVCDNIWQMLSGGSASLADRETIVGGAGPLSTVYAELKRLNGLVTQDMESATPIEKLPSLVDAIRMAREAESHFYRTDGDWANFRAVYEDQISRATTLKPLLYDDEEAPLQALLVRGPWYVARVDPGTFSVAHCGIVSHNRSEGLPDADSDSTSESEECVAKPGVVLPPPGMNGDGGRDGN